MVYLLIFIAVIVTLCAMYIYYMLIFWKRQNIPNSVTHNVNSFRNVIGFFDQNGVKNYGKIFGTYEILTPVLVVAEPELINKILVTNFADFPDRRFYLPPEKHFGTSITFNKFAEWKRSRPVISKSFSPANLKQISVIFDESIASLITELQTLDNQINVIEIKKYLENCLLDTGLKALFGAKIETENKEKNIIITHVKKILNLNFSVAKILALILPAFGKMFDINLYDKESADYLVEMVKNVIMERRIKTNVKYNDFVQFLLDSEITENNSNKDTKCLTTKEIIDNCLVFIIATNDNSTSALCHLLHALTTNPLVYEKLMKEVDHYSSEMTSKSMYEVVNSMVYLDACFKENLRFYPPVTNIYRVSNKNNYLKPDLFIPKGTIVTIPSYSVHHNPDNFENHDQFIPERFLPENAHKIKAGTFLPFGDGPRNCVGMRFAYVELKIFMARLLQAFKFESSDEKNKLEYFTGIPFLLPKSFSVKITKR